MVRIGALPLEQIEQMLAARHPDWPTARRSLVARLAEGAVGRALAFDLEGYLANLVDALVILHNAIREPDYSALFRMTESYRAGAEGQERLVGLIRGVYSLLEDMLLAQSGNENLLRNVDLATEVTRMAGAVSLGWIEGAARGLVELETGMRRNLLRSLALDSFAGQLAEQAGRS
jgi:DNA polymerase-3 subunit delta'